MRVTFLGSGTSHGIPVPTCHCPVCLSKDPRDKRWRSSLLLEKEGKSIVIDTGPEFRLQVLRAGVDRIDAVLYTHSHADHINGIDDLRVFCKDSPVPIYCDERVKRYIETVFGYALGSVGGKPDGLPHFALHELSPYEEVEIAGFPVTPIPVMHGRQEIFAYRVGSLVYATDTSALDERALEAMARPSVLIIGALRYKPHPTHFSIAEALEVARRTGAKRTYLTHMCHDVSHAQLLDALPPGVSPGYDTLSFEVD